MTNMSITIQCNCAMLSLYIFLPCMKINRNVTLHQEIFPSFRMGPLLPESFTPLILNHTNLNLLAKTSALMSRRGLSLPSQRTGCLWSQPSRRLSMLPTGTAPSSSSGLRCGRWCWWCPVFDGTRNMLSPNSSRTQAQYLQTGTE